VPRPHPVRLRCRAHKAREVVDARGNVPRRAACMRADADRARAHVCKGWCGRMLRHGVYSSNHLLAMKHAAELAYWHWHSSVATAVAAAAVTSVPSHTAAKVQPPRLHTRAHAHSELTRLSRRTSLCTNIPSRPAWLCRGPRPRRPMHALRAALLWSASAAAARSVLVARVGGRAGAGDVRGTGSAA
jgi:hypothetical protein